MHRPSTGRPDPTPRVVAKCRVVRSTSRRVPRGRYDESVRGSERSHCDAATERSDSATKPRKAHEKIFIMDAASLQSLVSEIAHPFGGVAFVDPIKKRNAQAERQSISYADEDAPPPPDPSDNTHEDGSNNSNNKRKRHGITRSVRLPNWMDLDRDSLPHGGHVGTALVDTVRQDPSQPVARPHVLDDFGGVGETTVQLRTARAPDDESFDASPATASRAAAVGASSSSSSSSSSRSSRSNASSSSSSAAAASRARLRVPPMPRARPLAARLPGDRCGGGGDQGVAAQQRQGAASRQGQGWPRKWQGWWRRPWRAAGTSKRRQRRRHLVRSEDRHEQARWQCGAQDAKARRGGGGGG